MNQVERDLVLASIEALKAEINGIYETIGNLNDDIQIQKSKLKDAQEELSQAIKKLSELPK